MSTGGTTNTPLLYEGAFLFLGLELLKEAEKEGYVCFVSIFPNRFKITTTNPIIN
jgi:hypothetical protein